MVWLSVDKRGRLRLSLAVVGFGSVLHCSVWPPCICPMLQLLFPFPFGGIGIGSNGARRSAHDSFLLTGMS